MMARRREGLSERHKRILKFLDEYQTQHGFPPAIREICDNTDISSTSVVNYYLKQLEEMEYIERQDNVSRGIRLLKDISGSLKSSLKSAANAVSEMINVPMVGRIAAGEPVPVPGSAFSYYDSESGVEIARSLLPSPEKAEELFALEVKGDSMIDAMVNDGDIVVLKPVKQAHNGEMVAIWLKDRDETTLKYFFLENGHVRLQPANPTMKPIMIDDPRTVDIQGKVVLIIRQLSR